MMDLSKTLQEDIHTNQINLKSAIGNHQALVVKLRGNLADPTEIKLKLADIQKHIISLGEAQKVLVARVKKEIAAKTWNNNNSLESDLKSNSLKSDSPNVLTNDSSSLTQRPGKAKRKDSTSSCRELIGHKRVYEEDDDDDGGDDDEEEECNNDGDEDFEEDEDMEDDIEEDNEDDGSARMPPVKRSKPMLTLPRPSSPVQMPDQQQFRSHHSGVPTSSDESQESTSYAELMASEQPSKVDFMSSLGLVTREVLSEMQSKCGERRRRRLAGQHSFYTNHWDLTVRRHQRTRVVESQRDGGDRHADQEYEKESSPIGSPPIVEVKKNEEEESGSDSTSPSPTPDVKRVCIICREKGASWICESCCGVYHRECLVKSKRSGQDGSGSRRCPQCSVVSVNVNGGSSPPSTTATANGESFSTVLGDTTKPPTLVSSMEVIARYYKKSHSSSSTVPPNTSSDAVDNAALAERLKVKKVLEARNATLKVDLASLEEKAAQLSESVVTQNTNIQELTETEERIKERIKRVVDFISAIKGDNKASTSPSPMPS